MNETSTDYDVCEIFLAINESGDWVVGTDWESTSESMANDYGGGMCRMAVIRVHINRPKMLHAEVDVQDENSEVIVTELEPATRSIPPAPARSAAE